MTGRYRVSWYDQLVKVMNETGRQELPVEEAMRIAQVSRRTLQRINQRNVGLRVEGSSVLQTNANLMEFLPLRIDQWIRRYRTLYILFRLVVANEGGIVKTKLIAKVQDRFGVAEAVANRDLRELQSLGLVQERTVTQPGRKEPLVSVTERFLALKPGQVGAFASRLSQLDELAPPDLRPSLKSLSQRLLRQRKANLAPLPSESPYIIYQGPGSVRLDLRPALVDLLEKAVLGRRQVQAVVSGNAVVLNPVGLLYHWERGRWYLYHSEGSEIRHVELNAIAEAPAPVLLRSTFLPPAGFRLDHHLLACWGIESGGRKYQVRLRVYEPKIIERFTAAVRHRTHCRLVELNDGSLEFTDVIEGLDEFADWVEQYGGAVEVFEPLELRRRLIARAEGVIRHYE